MSIPNLDAAGFGRSVADELQRRGLGSASKRELEALLLHLIERHSGLGALSNHDAGLLLRAQAQRIKTLRHEATLRFEEDIQGVARTKLADAMKRGRYDSGSDMVILVIEDAFGRDAVLAAFKRHGGHGDWKGGNSEVLQARSELVATVLAASLPAEDVEKFVSAVNRGKPGPARKAFKSIMTAVFSEMKNRGAGGVVDLAADQVGAHLADLARLAPFAIQIVRNMAM
jgi:hypothetical protein